MIETSRIEVKPDELAEIRRILGIHLPGCEVWAFGSRVKGSARPWSDLDLVVVGTDPIHWNELGMLTEAFQESELPFRVEVVDWHSTSPAFREVIESQYAIVQEPAA